MVLLAVWSAPQVCLAVTEVSGNLLTEAQRLENFSKAPFGEDSNNYVAPTGTEWNQFRAAADALFNTNIVQAEILAAVLDYELIRFTHTNSGRILFGLRCRETNGAPTKGWGTYFVNTNFAVSALIEATHPQFDFRSPVLAADIFLKAGARGFLLAGANRHANGTNTADPCDLTNTIFHAVHAAWNGNSGENTAWQIHGFSVSGHPEFPASTLAVLSTGQSGTNWMSTNVVRLDQRLEWNGIKSYAYNRFLATNDPMNLLVNEGVAGQTFTNLAAQSNVQGQFSRGIGGTFVHVETATVVRTNVATRTAAADAVASAVLLSRTNALPTLNPFLLTNPVRTNGMLQFSIAAELFRAFDVELRQSLATNGTMVYTFPGDGQSRVITNLIPTDANGFYRVRGW
ncbi:MAG: hypothetical protein JWM68_4408 [Verrucomicrobiales bacterium]|nr:hypothetical protein [Verrucomicrobiales bacterium]